MERSSTKPSTPLQMPDITLTKRFFFIELVSPGAFQATAAALNSVLGGNSSGQRGYPGTRTRDRAGQNVITSTDNMSMTRNGNVAEYTCMMGFSKR